MKVAEAEGFEAVISGMRKHEQHAGLAALLPAQIIAFTTHRGKYVCNKSDCPCTSARSGFFFKKNRAQEPQEVAGKPGETACTSPSGRPRG